MSGDVNRTCGWPTGTAASGPATCNRKARATCVVTRALWEMEAGDHLDVCGTHRRLVLHSGIWSRYLNLHDQMLCPVTVPHCELCGATEDIYRPDDGYSVCCYKQIVSGRECRSEVAHDD